MTKSTLRTSEAATAPNGEEKGNLATTPRGTLGRLLQHKAGAFAFWALVAVVLIAVVTPILPLPDPDAQDLRNGLSGPTFQHWLGLDNLGRDVLSRLLYASRVSLLAATEAMGVALVLGLPLGLLSGYAGGWIDQVSSRVIDGIMSMPALILALVIVGILGPSLSSAMLAIGIVSTPNFFRIVRGAAINVRHEAYIEVARSAGASVGRLLWRHVLPNIRSAVFVHMALVMSHAILVEAALSFVGLGVQLPQSSWGSMLRQASSVLGSAPLPYVLGPGVTIVLVVLSLNMLGDALRDVSSGRSG